MDFTMIRAVAGDETLVIISAKLFDAIITIANESLERNDLAKWVNCAENRDALPIALMQRLMNGEAPHRLFRELRGLSSVDLARAVGLPHDYITGIEAGQIEETLADRRKIAEALRIKMDDLELAK